MGKWIFGVVLAAMFLAWSGPANAQTKVMVQLACFPKDAVKSRMARVHKEAPILQAVTNNGLLLEVLANKDGSSWTVHMVNPDGTSCLAASGQGVFIIEYKAPETPS